MEACLFTGTCLCLQGNGGSWVSPHDMLGLASLLASASSIRMDSLGAFLLSALGKLHFADTFAYRLCIHTDRKSLLYETGEE